MNQTINELNISSSIKKILFELGFTTVSELENYNYFSLLKQFPKCHTLDKIVTELNPLGYLLPPKTKYLFTVFHSQKDF